MPKIVRIPITNVYMNGDYTGRVLVGPHHQPMHVILDTGSSAFAVDGRKYHPDTGAGDKTTTIAQTDGYGDGSGWTGAVLKATVAVGDGGSQVAIAEANDLYTGAFQTVKVLADEWYTTNLKAVIVGNTAPIHVPVKGPHGMPSNSNVDSGTNSLNIGRHLLKAIVAKFSPAQQALLNASVFGQSYVSASQLNLPSWPDITFVLQGDAGDVRLRVAA